MNADLTDRRESMQGDEERTPGAILPHGYSLDEVLGTLKGELSMWLWWINVQSGPFTPPWRDDPKNQSTIDRLSIVVPEFVNTSMSAWNRGFVPKLHPHVWIDEWTYFYASNCEPNEFPRRAAESNRLLSKSNNSGFFRSLATTGDLFMMHVDGWWEVYTNNEKWRHHWLTTFPEAYLRTRKKLGEAPEIPFTA